jgi:hypothetical protein
MGDRSHLGESLVDWRTALINISRHAWTKLDSSVEIAEMFFFKRQQLSRSVMLSRDPSSSS